MISILIISCLGVIWCCLCGFYEYRSNEEFKDLVRSFFKILKKNKRDLKTVLMPYEFKSPVRW